MMMTFSFVSSELTSFTCVYDLPGFKNKSTNSAFTRVVSFAADGNLYLLSILLTATAMPVAFCLIFFLTI